jgi:NADPH-dependent glutamate synthase beta subunit-like oxidoreductase
MILCGGNLVGVCSETLISGYDIVRPMIRGLKDYMDAHGYETLDGMRGLVVPQVRTAVDVTLHDGYARIKNPNLSAPCKSACPHHVPAQAYVQKVASGEYRAAYDLITGTNALQNVCAFVCDHPCEDACTRGEVDAPVRIREIKRFVLDYGKRHGWKPAWTQAAPNGYRIAVVGSGAAGLSCASELRRAGYDVTIFEKDEHPGGALRSVTPAFRIDRAALDETIAQMEAAGVRFVCGKSLGKDFTIERLRSEGYESVFLAIGTENAAEVAGAEDARDFLARAKEDATAVSGSVLVCGDGIGATDAARTALRLGAKKVSVLLGGGFSARSGVREQQALAKEEGVRFLEHAALIAVTPDGADVLVGGETLRYPCDRVIVAGAGRVDESVLGGVAAERGGIRVTAATGETNVPGVYAGGDAVRQTNVIAAIASAKRAAAAIDRAIRGDGATLAGIPSVQTVDGSAFCSATAISRKTQTRCASCGRSRRNARRAFRRIRA